MNMTRAIIEGIHEVELEITPEFQKEPRDDGVHVWVMHDAHKKNGWVRDSDHQEGDTVTYTYHHPMLAGAAMRYSFSAHSGMVLDQMLVTSGEGAEPLRFDPDPDMVAKLTKDWLEIQEKTPEIHTVVHMLVQLNWVTMSDTPIFGAGAGGAKARVFQHPKVGRKIRVTYGPETGAIIGALVLQPDGTLVGSIDKAPASIYQKAQELMKEAGA